MYIYISIYLCLYLRSAQRKPKQSLWTEARLEEFFFDEGCCWGCRRGGEVRRLRRRSIQKARRNNKWRCPNEASTKHENNCTLHQYQVLNMKGKSANNSSSGFHKQAEKYSKSIRNWLRNVAKLIEKNVVKNMEFDAKGVPKWCPNWCPNQYPNW